MAKFQLWKIIPSQSYPPLEPVVLPQMPENLNQASYLLPGGCYTTFRTYQGARVLSLDDHLRRLEESAALLGRPVSLDRHLVRRSLRAALEHFNNGEARLRLTLDLEQQPGTLYLALEMLQLPSPQDYREGVRAATCRSHRQNPEAKYTAFITVAESIRSQLPASFHECLLVDGRGRILEGLSSNFFAVQEGQLFTAPDAILSGITRALVLKTATSLGLPVRMEAVTAADIPDLQEAFLTSATRAVLPVRQIDDQVVGGGRPGNVTRLLAEAYQAEVERLLEVV
jgi:branched-chain amino acid aminotransferase